VPEYFGSNMSTLKTNKQIDHEKHDFFFLCVIGNNGKMILWSDVESVTNLTDSRVQSGQDSSE